MKKKNVMSILLVLIVTLSSILTGCQNTTVTKPNQVTENTVANVTKVGEGQTVFDFVVEDKDNNKTYYEVHTNKETVGDALKELNMVSGEEGAYGLYVKEVNGIIADYDQDKTYWAFYINDEYASTGIDSTNIVAGNQYTLKVAQG